MCELTPRVIAQNRSVATFQVPGEQGCVGGAFQLGEIVVIHLKPRLEMETLEHRAPIMHRQLPYASAHLNFCTTATSPFTLYRPSESSMFSRRAMQRTMNSGRPLSSSLGMSARSLPKTVGFFRMPRFCSSSRLWRRCAELPWLSKNLDRNWKREREPDGGAGVHFSSIFCAIGFDRRLSHLQSPAF